MEFCTIILDDALQHPSHALKSFTKKATNFSEQVKRLESRGMVFEDKNSANLLLHHISYYRLEAYWYTYYDPTKESHQFFPETSFRDVLRDYSFDQELRTLILVALAEIEISFRTQFTYCLSHKYGAFPFQKTNFILSDECWDRSIDELREICSTSKEQFAVHLRNTYNCTIFPVWAATELMSFGKLVLFYSNIRDRSLMKQISQNYGLQPDILVSWLNHLCAVRNLCAHHHRIWNRRFVKTPREAISIHEDIKKRWLGTPSPVTDTDPRNDRRIYNTLLIINYLLSNINHHIMWKQEIVKLIDKYDIETQRMGFPCSWKTDAYWVAEKKV